MGGVLRRLKPIKGRVETRGRFGRLYPLRLRARELGGEGKAEGEG